MTNLPPGVTVGMIPGNRPEDDADEAFWQAVYDRIPEGAGDPPEGWEDSYLIAIVREIAYEAGRADERAEQQIEAAMTPNPTFTDAELEALARMFSPEFREDEAERSAVQKTLSAQMARDPDWFHRR